MAKALVIVESPAKMKTINKFLGDDFKVLSSMGHLIDLPKSTLGVDVDDNFAPKFVVVRKKQKFLTLLKKEAKSKKEIYIATDPDREGEAIGWNIAHHLNEDDKKVMAKKKAVTKKSVTKKSKPQAATGKKFYRVSFHEITKDAVLKAFQNTREFDLKKVDAQIARRILDRIVGYQISPLLWKKVGSRLSAGRVQSVALRLVVERERAIAKFVPQEYWQIAVELKKKGLEVTLIAGLEKINKTKFESLDEKQAKKISEELKTEEFVIADVSKKEVRRNPSPPFITSTLQQEAFNKLGFNTTKTMLLAQQLYEGIEINEEGATGLITYMRTDSVNISLEAIGKVRTFIKNEYGEKYHPEKPNVYKSKKSAQEAHEAVRPADVFQTPQSLRKFLDEDQYKLYELIWKRFVSSQMVPAVYEQKKIEINAGIYQFGVSGSTLLFEGFLSLSKEDKEEEQKVDLTPYVKEDKLDLVGVKPSQHFTKPPPRYSEASLVKALEEDGIGRPSTYASIIQTLVYRNYVQRDRGYFMATELGMKICDLLVEYFPKIMDIGFTAMMEEKLDLVEEGTLEYPKLLSEFYKPFKEELDFAMTNIVKTEEFVDKDCPQCGKKMTVKWGRKGKFLSCSGFPECKFAQPFLTGVKCPEVGCTGELVVRRSKRGSFYGCSNYPNCTHITKELPS